MRIDHDFIDLYCDGLVRAVNGGPGRGRPEDEEYVPEVAGLRSEMHDLVDRFMQERPTGLRGNAPADAGGPTNDVDEVTGEPIPQRPDPTFATVLERQQRGPVEIAIDEGTVALTRSHSLIQRAIGFAKKAKPPENVQTSPDAIWCTNHELYRLHEPRGKTKNGAGEEVDLPGGLCWACYRHLRAEGWLPTKRILDLKALGKHLTASILAEESPHRPGRRAKARTKR